MQDTPLRTWREQLNIVDAKIIALLADRFRITDQVGVYKKANRLPIVDLARESEQAASFRTLAERHGLDPNIAERIARNIIGEVTRRNHNLYGS